MLKGGFLNDTLRKERFDSYIKPLILKNLTITEMSKKIDLKPSQLRVECNQLCTKELYDLLKKNTKEKVQLKSDNNKRREANKQRYFKVIQPLIWEGLTTIDIVKKLNLKVGSVVRFDTKRFGTLEDNAQLKLNGIIKKRNVLVKLMTDKTSRPEKDLYSIAKKYFSTAQHKYLILSDKEYYWELDVAVPDLKLNFEYDGYHWHKNQQSREEKRDQYLNKLGWKVIRFKYGESPTYEELELAFKDRVLSL
jgi:hypothetical protein